jgi:hypothetical protein
LAGSWKRRLMCSESIAPVAQEGVHLRTSKYIAGFQLSNSKVMLLRCLMSYVVVLYQWLHHILSPCARTCCYLWSYHI